MREALAAFFSSIVTTISMFNRVVTTCDNIVRVAEEESESFYQDVKNDREQRQAAAPLTWAQRLKRVFNIDITTCPLCGGTMRVIADITDPDIIQKILDHIRGPPRSRPPPLNPATAIQS